jgi:hypothetical protein
MIKTMNTITLGLMLRVLDVLCLAYDTIAARLVLLLITRPPVSLKPCSLLLLCGI